MALKLYRVRQPDSLQSLATNALASWIPTQAEKLFPSLLDLCQRNPTEADELISSQIEITRRYLETNLPGQFHDELAVEAMRAIIKLQRKVYKRTITRHSAIEQPLPKTRRSCISPTRDHYDTTESQISQYDRNVKPMCRQTNVIARMIETIFTRHLTRLSLDSKIDDAVFLPTLCLKSCMLSGLNRLNIKSLIHNLNETKLIQILKELHNLKDLSLKGCTHEVIKCLVENCKLIEALELYDDHFEEDTVELLTQLPNLKSISLEKTSLTQKAVETLLTDRIVEIAIESPQTYLLTGALENMANASDKRFALTSFQVDRKTTRDQLKVVASMCPIIHSLRLGLFMILQNYLSLFYNLQELGELKLSCHGFYANGVKELLQMQGCNIFKLDFRYVKQIDLNALECLSQTCPNLESLTLAQCHYEYGHSLVNKAPELGSTLNNLKSLTLKSLIGRRPQEEHLFYLLSNCPNIEIIDVYPLQTTDELMLRVLARNPMMYLKKLRLNSCDVTTLTFLDRIVQNRQKPPEILISSLEESVALQRFDNFN